MKKRRKEGGMKPTGKVIIFLLILGALVAGYFYFGDKVIDKFGDEPTKIGVVTWPGYAAGQYMNDGFAANKECRFYKEYGIEVEFIILDNYLASRKAFENGDVDLLWCTVDALPVEMGQSGTLASYDPKFIFQADWSRGGDAIVVRLGIETGADLKGKKVSVAQGTPSHSFLIDFLDANSLEESDIEVIFVENAIKAAEMFKQGGVDAAVVWSPDDIDCVNKVDGSKILASTKTATHIIADGFYAKAEYIEANREKLQKLYEDWMVGASELNSNKAGSRDKAAKILADQFQMSEADALATLDNVRFATHGDNLDFFGISGNKAMTGDALYSRMSGVYVALGYADNPITWRDISDVSIVKVGGADLTGIAHKAEPQKEFTVITEEVKTKKAFTNKAVTINFPTASSTLSSDDKHTILVEFVGIAKRNAGARIRIEGNTDNTGFYNLNKELSLKRAQAVKNYLVQTHGIDENRIIVIGNGPDQAIADGCEGPSEAHRKTDFQLISE